jgi:multimeric flavodoxin WrbA
MAHSETLRAVVIGCSLNSTEKSKESSSELLGRQVLDALADHDVDGEVLRAADLGIKFGVSTDEGDGDGWPGVREKILDAHILVLATPIWMGQPASMAKVVLERLDAEISDGTLQNKVAVVAVVGNEDGAHHIIGILFQGLNDVGFTIPAQGAVYWNGEAMTPTDYKDLDGPPDAVATTTRTLAANAVHLFRQLAPAPYPPKS